MVSIQELEKTLQKLSEKEFVSLTFNKAIKEKCLQNKTFYIIGNDYEAAIGINKLNGEVYSLAENDLVFINSSLTMLIDFIGTFLQKIDFDEDYIESKRKKDVKEMVKQLKAMDKKAMREGTWWSLILEQTEDGLL